MGEVWECQIQSAIIILKGLLRSHSHSLNNESLRTLITKVELIINSRPLTIKTICNSKSELPLSPSNLLTMKTSVIMPPLGQFSKADAYSKRRWQCVQHIVGEFWSRWRSEFPQSLQVKQAWKKGIQNIAVGNIVLLRDDCHRNQWPMARIVGNNADAKNDVRSIALRVPDKKGGPSQVLKHLMSLKMSLIPCQME